MAESNKMKDMPVNKLMIQMGIPMILSLSLIHILFTGSGKQWNAVSVYDRSYVQKDAYADSIS